MKLLGKGWTAGEATAWSDVHGCGCIVHGFPHLKQHAFCIAHYWNFVYWNFVLSQVSHKGHGHFNASTSIQQIASLKDIIYIYVFIIKIITSKDLSITFSISGINVCLFCTFFSPKKNLLKCFLVSGQEGTHVSEKNLFIMKLNWETKLWPLTFYNKSK